MSIILFIVILIILIFVHELGHFLVAKKSGIRVDEFGFGYPPRVFGWKPKGSETTYSLNWLPFGGFVKIFGENPDEESINGEDKARSFVHQKKRTQAAVLFAGVFFNFVFAWLLLSITLMLGVPTSLDDSALQDPSKDASILITSVLPDSPAESVGIKVGDEIISLGSEEVVIPDSVSGVSDIIKSSENELVLNVLRAGEEETFSIVPESGIISDGKAIGINMSVVGVEKWGVVGGIIQGLDRSITITKEIVVGFSTFIYQAVVGSANFSQIAGPVGIVSMVGDASTLGFVFLLTFTAFISLNLAVLNLIPFPALDGGRLLFVLIEKIKGSPIKPKIANMANLIGFGLLILLMIIVTYNDIARLI